jgi:integrase/recombinase XerC
MKSKKEIQIFKKNEIDIKQTAWNSLSAESQTAYGNDFRLFFDFINKPAEKVVASDILSYIEYLREKKYKNSTINRKIASLSKLFKVMMAAGETTENPVETLKQFKNISFRTNKEVKISLTIKDIKEAVKKPSKEDKKIIIISKMLAKSGLRISEMINIKNDDIEKYDENNHIIRIVGKGNKERSIFIEDSFLKTIRKEYPETGSEYLFYNKVKKRLDRRLIWAKIREFFFRKIGKKVHPHMLRHFFATHKINTEKQDIKAVSKFLGHASVSTTLESYVDTSLDVNQSKIKI